MSVSPASRDEVVKLIDGSVANVNLRRHMLATEAVMRGLAVRLGDDPEVWGLAGLAHDLDAEETAGEVSRHGARAAERLTALGLPPELVHAVAAHNPATGAVVERPIDVALIAADQTTGLITAATLVRPDRSLPQVKLSSVRKRMREGAFARGVDRGSILRCEELGLDLDEFLAIALAAMQAVAADLGLAGE
ncbi:MAG: HDIG domain-containing metalloprotein [Thermoleophilia bacterium]